MTYELKKVAPFRLLYVMAAVAEYGPHLRARIRPLMTGVGPVEAAVSVTRALAELHARNTLPDLVVCLGSAGSAKLEQAEVYQATSVSYRDMDASPLGFEKGATPFLDLPVTVPLPIRIPGVPEARLSTGANIVSGNAYATIDADMVEMETFAVLRACQAYDVKLVGLRGISDGKAELKHIGDWTEYLHIIDEKLSDVIDTLEGGLREGTITP
ncbi:5'-methylthioadenosine/S-adenosylhomocysteine nucleosidase [Sinorhizobium sp. BG8]|uniref:5'-methylthioadenosine/S-adenosylhomocysteine nucleosidase n=1 Tax=Sinorhizobium sp. BG8 TaxID=2613773 RepID=UPI00193E8C51|nr:5'-methylthioadenosine/S-adenosylhomocysteine nucleosidase [Sinorhizobium sp. BG8]QRM53962.1 5'-methylthioadenosine/S-adenosylhomocysteine nucleosidase [Sinorhizobium sp. BG8]